MSTPDHGMLDVQHDEDAQRYVLRRSGDTVGLMRYERDGEVFDVIETRIFPEVRGEGLAGVLVRDALTDIREHGARVQPTCWYVRSFIEANEEFADLVTG